MDPNEAKPVLGARSKSGLEMLYLYSGLDICIPIYKDIYIYIYKVSLYIYIYTYIYMGLSVEGPRGSGLGVWRAGFRMQAMQASQKRE